MTNPNDIPQDVWGAALKCAETVCRNLDYPNVTAEVTAIARAIMAAKEEERGDIWAIASSNAATRRELERLAMEAGDAEGCLLHALLARENDQIADAILDRKLANNTNKD